MAVLIVLLCFVFVHCSYATVTSFGFKVAPVSEAGSAESGDQIRTTLHWDTEILQCLLVGHTHDQYAYCEYDKSLCDTSSISQYKMNLDILGTDGLWVTEIQVIEDYGATITGWSDFCSSLSFPNGIQSGNCETTGWTGLTETNLFCIDGDASCNSYSSVEIDLSQQAEASVVLSSPKATINDACLQPTGSPTPQPTDQNCEDSKEIKHINWDNLISNGGDEIPEISYNINVSSSDLILSIDLELDYLGYSWGIDDVYGFGTTYHLGFYLFDGGLNGNNIYEPSNCDNRISSSFVNTSWAKYWEYSEYPYLYNQIGTDQYLAYPTPSKYWTISPSLNNSCSKIKYSAIFGWDELINCKSYDQISKLVDVDIDDEYINMTGIFYVNAISPISKDIDINSYYVYELLSYPFLISVEKAIYLLDSVGIFLFTASIINVGKKNDESLFNIILLTESADYISLSNPLLLSSPNNNQNKFLFINNNSQCLSISSNICSQIWELEATVNCPFTFSGQYALQFTAACDNNPNTQCSDYINQYGSTVSLTDDLVFNDNICNDITWSIQYDAEMTFYDINTFITPVAGNHMYVVGEDTIYVEIVINDINIDNNGYAILDTQLLNVWLCTIDEQQYGQLILDKNDITNSGCFSSNIDDDGPYHIIVNYNSLFTNNAQHENATDNNMVRFSFVSPNTISRDTLYIEAQINLKFSDGVIRRLLLHSKTTHDANQMEHFVGKVSINENDTNNMEKEDNDDNYYYLYIIIGVLIAITIGFVIYVLIYKVKKNKVSGQVQVSINQNTQSTQAVNE